MKHTDTLLGIVEQDRERERTVEQMRDEAAKTLMALQTLRDNPGWALFMQRLKDDRTHALIQLAKADGAQLPKVAGILLQIESNLAWLEDTSTELTQAIKAE